MGDRVGEQLLRFLESVETEILAMLEAFVDLDTQWSNPSGVKELGRQVSSYLYELGFSTKTIPQPAVDQDRMWLAEVLAPGVKYEFLAPTHVASRAGRRGDRTLLLGDLDTAFPVREKTPFYVEDGRAFGAGVADMKGGLVTMLWALQALAELSLQTPPLDVVLSGDEQAGSLGSSSVISQVAKDAPWTLCMECARDEGKYMVSRGHIGVGRLDVTGKASHAGSDRAAGRSAVRRLAELIPAIDDLTSYHEGILVTVTMVTGGTRRSVVPGEAKAVLDLRAFDAAGWGTLVDRLHDLVGPDDLVQLRADYHRPSVEPGAGTFHLVEWIREDSEFVGGFPGTTTSAAAGSSAFAAASGSAVLDGAGPPGGALMTDEEYVEIGGMAERAALLGSLLHRLAEEPTGRAKYETRSSN